MAEKKINTSSRLLPRLTFKQKMGWSAAIVSGLLGLALSYRIAIGDPVKVDIDAFGAKGGINMGQTKQ